MSFGKPKDEVKAGVDSAVASMKVPAAGGQKTAAYLGQGTRVVGKLVFSGPVELDGYIEGEIESQEKLIIGEGSEVKAKIVGSEIIIKGHVQGDIMASRKLSLQRPAKVVGNIASANLSIEEGVIFEGQCSMSSMAGATKR